MSEYQLVLNDGLKSFINAHICENRKDFRKAVYFYNKGIGTFTKLSKSKKIPKNVRKGLDQRNKIYENQVKNLESRIKNGSNTSRLSSLQSTPSAITLSSQRSQDSGLEKSLKIFKKADKEEAEGKFKESLKYYELATSFLIEAAIHGKTSEEENILIKDITLKAKNKCRSLKRRIKQQQNLGESSSTKGSTTVNTRSMKSTQSLYPICVEVKKSYWSDYSDDEESDGILADFSDSSSSLAESYHVASKKLPNYPSDSMWSLMRKSDKSKSLPNLGTQSKTRKSKSCLSLNVNHNIRLKNDIVFKRPQNIKPEEPDQINKLDCDWDSGISNPVEDRSIHDEEVFEIHVEGRGSVGVLNSPPTAPPLDSSNFQENESGKSENNSPPEMGSNEDPFQSYTRLRNMLKELEESKSMLDKINYRKSFDSQDDISDTDCDLCVNFLRVMDFFWYI